MNSEANTLTLAFANLLFLGHPIYIVCENQCMTS